MRISREGTKPRKKTAISVDAELYEWVLTECTPGGMFGSVSHAVELGWKLLREDVTRLKEIRERRIK